MSEVVRYRIYTEHVSPVIIGRHFDGFTIVRAVGYWQGKAEQSAVVEIIARPDDAARVQTIAREIREQYRQAEVWITTESVSLTRVTIDAITEGLPS